MRYICLFILLLSVAPSYAQRLYSYVNPEGRLVITDQPVKQKGYKLKSTFVPKRAKVQEAKKAETLSRELRRIRGKRLLLTKAQMSGLVDPIAKAMQVDPNLVKAVIQIESSGNVRAESHKGAMGLMQLIPATAQRFGVKNAWDPRQNIRGGVSYLRYLLSYFQGNVDLVLAAYNAGENAVDRHGGIPPYKETRRYVKKIRKIYADKTHPFDTNVAKRKSKLVAVNATGATTGPRMTSE